MKGAECSVICLTVIKAYRDVLGRDPDPQGIQTYVRHLAHGDVTQDKLRFILMNSAEARSKELLEVQERVDREGQRLEALESKSGLLGMCLVDTITDPSFQIMALDAEEDRVVSGELLATNFYTADVSNLFYSLFKGASDAERSDHVIVDAGANIGYYTLFSLASGFDVIAFEPQQRACKMLRMSSAANEFHRLTLVNAALSDRSGVAVRIGYTKGNWGGSSTYNDDARSCFDHAGDVECVMTTTLDSHVKTQVFLLKIDVEGHEAEVLDGASNVLQNFRPKHILMEYRPEQLALVKRMLSRGYMAFNVREWDFFGQNGSAVFNTSFAPMGLIDLSLATPLTLNNIILLPNSLIAL